jgi:hypothetical protein
MRTLTALLALALLCGCSVTDLDLTYVNRRPLDPAIVEMYGRWYTEVERCLQLPGDSGSVRWHVADEIVYNGRRIYGLLKWPHNITIDRVSLWEPTVPHEIVHHITGTGDELHDANDRVPCEDTPYPSH